MRRSSLAVSVCSLLLLYGYGWSQAAPNPKDTGNSKIEPKKEKAPGFKPVEIDNELAQTDPNDAKTNNPAKKYTVKLAMDKTYIIDLVSKDFDAYLRLLDKKGKSLAEDDDSGGDLNAQIIHTMTAGGDHEIVVTSFDGQVGKFTLKVREFTMKGEAKPRTVGENGLTIDGTIAQNDVSPLGKLGKVYSVQLKKGQAYTIDLESQDIDSYLYLFDSKSKMLAQDDDTGGNLNSRIVFRPEQDGVYHLLASSLGGEETGDFTLKVNKE